MIVRIKSRIIIDSIAAAALKRTLFKETVFAPVFKGIFALTDILFEDKPVKIIKKYGFDIGISSLNSVKRAGCFAQGVFKPVLPFLRHRFPFIRKKTKTERMHAVHTPQCLSTDTIVAAAPVEPVPVVITKAFLLNISIRGATVITKKSKWSKKFFMLLGIVSAPQCGLAKIKASA